MGEGDPEEREALKEKLLDILVERGLFSGGSSGKGLPFVLTLLVTRTNPTVIGIIATKAIPLVRTLEMRLQNQRLIRRK